MASRTPNSPHPKKPGPIEPRWAYRPPAELLKPPETFQEAYRGMVDAAFLSNRKWQEQQWRALRNFYERRPHPSFPEIADVRALIGAHPDMLDFERKLVKRFADMGIPMFCHNFIRDGAYQDALKAAGHSKTDESAHEYGCAFDLVHSTKGWNLDKRQWALIGHVGKEVAQQCGLKITWGGDWAFYDPAHWELVNWRKIKGEYPWPTPLR